jgi:hypothetical protein
VPRGFKGNKVYNLFQEFSSSKVESVVASSRSMVELETGLEVARERIALVVFRISHLHQVLLGFSDLNETCVGEWFVRNSL